MDEKDRSNLGEAAPGEGQPAEEDWARALRERREAYHLLEDEDARRALEEGRDLDHEAKLAIDACGIVRVSDVAERGTTWLWPGFFPWGEMSIVEGDPDVGKTLAILSVIAAVSSGTPLPGRHRPRRPETALFLTSEDSIAKTVRPRLEAAGANLDRVLTQKPDASELLLPGAVKIIEAIVRGSGARVVVLDPLNAYLDANEINVNREQDVRQALKPLRDLAERRNLAIIGLRHLSKNTDKPSLYRGGGSIGLAAIARSVVLVAKHPDDRDLRVLVSQKCNVAAEEMKRPQGFRIRPDERGRPHVEWQKETVEIDADELLAPKRPGPKADGQEAAARYIRDHLADGKKPRAIIVDDGVKTGLSEKTIDRAAHRVVKVVSTPNEQDPKKRDWSLPPERGS
jgi:hypothetical protein